MTNLPLYQEARTDNPSLQTSSHAGLWYNKFCNKWSTDWTMQSQQNSNPKLKWIQTVCKKPVGETAHLTHHTNRITNLTEARNGYWGIFRLRSRFATGLGSSHPVENGFTWHPTLGTPYLPGSSVKGLTRAWVCSWSDTQPSPEVLRRIFGSDEKNPSQQTLHTQAGSVIFLDATPYKPPQLTADVMTPHYSPYYQDSTGSIPPADWHSPMPIPFLVVETGAIFQFAIAPRHAAGQQDQDDCQQAWTWLTQALDELGAGAKTAVGYGWFKRDEEIEKTYHQQREKSREADQHRRQQEQQARDKEAKIAETTADMTDMAKEFYCQSQQKDWHQNKEAFLIDENAPDNVLEKWLGKLEAEFDAKTLQMLQELINHHIPGLLENPNKIKGKKKPAYTNRQRKIAEQINKLANENAV